MSCEDLRLLLYSRFRHAVFYFVVVDIMCSSFFALFHTWEVLVLFCATGTGDWNYSGKPIALSFIIFTYLWCELMDEGWNDVNTEE